MAGRDAREVVMLPPEQLRPYLKNAKRHPRKQIDKLKASIREFGFKVPVMVDAEMVLITGHGRTQAAKELGLAEIPVIVADDLTLDQANAMRIADNDIAADGKIDKSLLDMALQEIDISALTDYAPEMPVIDLDGIGSAVEEVFQSQAPFLVNVPTVFEDSGDFDIPNLQSDQLYVPADHIVTWSGKLHWGKGVHDNDPDAHVFIRFGDRHQPPEAMDVERWFIHGFCEDDVLERQYTNIHDVAQVQLEEGFPFATEWNFSLNADMSEAEWVYNVYRTRRVGRGFQTYGMKVCPTVDWCNSDALDIALIGVPKNPPCIILQIQSSNERQLRKSWLDGLARIQDHIQPETVLVYGSSANSSKLGAAMEAYPNMRIVLTEKQMRSDRGKMANKQVAEVEEELLIS